MKKVDKIPGGLTDNWSIEDVAKKHEVSIDNINKELEIGVKIEFEHTNKREIAKEIALDHLYELPDYYTRLKDMENKAEKEMNENKENITDYARRMRELAGISEGNNLKSIKTVDNGNSSFDGGMTFMAKDMMTSNDKKKNEVIVKENFASPEFYEEEKNEALRYLNNTSGWVTTLYDEAQNELIIYKDVIGLDAVRDDISEDEIETYQELLVDEVLEIINSGKVRVYTKDSLELSKEIDEEFETHKFEQKTIEDGTDDEELYNINENTIIILDFLNESDNNDVDDNDVDDNDFIDQIEKAHNEYEKEKDEKKYNSDEWVEAQENMQDESSRPDVRNNKKRKGPTDSATWHDEGTEMKGNDGKMWKIVIGSNLVNRWVRA